MCQKQKPIVDELEIEYKGRIDIIRYDLATPEGYCEFAKHGFTHIPAMIYFARDGRQIETTEQFEEKDALKAKLENMLVQ